MKTTAEIDDIRSAFDDLIEGVPKTRRTNHLFAINEISLILDAMDREAKKVATK